MTQKRPHAGKPRHADDRPRHAHPGQPGAQPARGHREPARGPKPMADEPRARPERGERGERPERPERGERRGGGHGPAPAPHGAVWLYGTHAVGAALQNPHRRFRRLVITEEAQAALAAECPAPWPVPPEIAPREKIDQILGAKPGSGIVHQGIALLTDQLTAPALQEALKRPGPVLVLDQIFDPRNVGALMRTAQAFGACCVIAQDRNAPEETGALAKAASGALEAIPLLRIVNISRALMALKAAEFWVVGLAGEAPTRLRAESFAGRRVALVLGSEGEGMRRLTRETCDELCSLAMPGGMESLNVSAAGAVSLYELTRTP
ncbi:RNA methyltransferase [Acidocella sp.]|uniref:TrmH family RNA methyltransferase n=2 Tax=Acidocella sp. TaxID=50710 RepID=UPI00262A3893|nr:RNA methyltransferase [Acidocella sp.]